MDFEKLHWRWDTWVAIGLVTGALLMVFMIKVWGCG